MIADGGDEGSEAERQQGLVRLMSARIMWMLPASICSAQNRAMVTRAWDVEEER